MSLGLQKHEAQQRGSDWHSGEIRRLQSTIAISRARDNFYSPHHPSEGQGLRKSPHVWQMVNQRCLPQQQ